MDTEAHDFQSDDVVAGHVALDFVNTVTARDTSPIDWLDGYPRLIEWAAIAGLVDARTGSNLRSQSEDSPREAAAALTRARKMREALHDSFVSLLTKRAVTRSALEEIESAWKRATARGRLASGDGCVRFETGLESSGLDLPLDLIVLAAVDLLGELDTERTRICRGHHCGWLFIDSSKGGRRVWCDMATCGNLAKSQRFARAEKRRRRKG
jgi:predicted RNA-binding Zn ribbon-like protein